VKNDATNNGGTNGGGGGGGNTATTRRPSTGTTRTTSGATTTSPTTSPFTFDAQPNETPTTLGRPPRRAIVLNTQNGGDDGVPVGVGLAGIVSLALAALAMSYNLRKTLTTLP
jgi:hypothetical protein